jgi:hypothetical protein
MTQNNMVAVGSAKTISSRAGSVFLGALTLITQLLNVPVLVDIAGQRSQILPGLPIALIRLACHRRPYVSCTTFFFVVS